MSFMRHHGPASMLKDGSTFVDEPVLKSIHACKELAKITSTSMGPYGLCKMVINHMNKLFVTHNAATIMRELEVEHPAAKLLVMACQAMKEEVGDGTNFVMSFAGELLSQAESLIRMGLHPSDITAGYTTACEKALSLLDGYPTTATTVSDVTCIDQVLPALRTAIGSKQFGNEDFLAKLVGEACINACPANCKSFDVDNVRVAKLDGDSLLASRLVRGFVVARGTEGTVKHLDGAKVAMYSCAIDIPATETKGTVLIESADELMSYSKREEDMLDHIIGVDC